MKLKLSSLLLLLPQILMAHPGHDDDLDGGYSIHHYLTSPYHLSIGAAIIGFAVFLVWFVRRRNRKQQKQQTQTKNA